MKLIELNLRAYGPFTNKAIQFENGSGNSGLHLILGPNEAGKSTALRALRAVLFGMEEKRDAHLHPWDMLRVGLKLRTPDGQMLDVERRKGKGSKSLLFTGSEKAASLQDVLPVNDADLFEKMFGIDYERLLKGGRELADFKGEMGQAILAAAGDLGETVSRMQELQRLADEIYAPQASSRKLNKALADYKAAEKKIRDERFTSRAYKLAVARRNELEEELNQIASELARCAEEQNRLTRFQTAAPHVQRWQEDQEELKTFSDAILLLSDFEQRFHAVTTERRMATGQRDNAQAELSRLNQELSSLSRDPLLAGLVAEIDALKDQSSQIQKARVDFPKRESLLQERMKEREKLCAELGIQPEAVPRVTAEQRSRVESLSDKYSGLETKREELRIRLDSLHARLREAKLTLSEIPADIDTSELKRQLARIPKTKQSGTETKPLRKERDDLQVRLETGLQAFPLWSGTAEQLETARVPLPPFLTGMSERFTKQESREEQLSKERDKLAGEVKRCGRSLERLEQQGSIPTEEELSESRSGRDLGWAAIKNCWLEGIENGAAEATFLSGKEKSLPDAFESAVQTADSVADRLRLEAERVEQKRSALEERDRAHEQLAGHEKAIEEARLDRSRLDSEWNALWADSGIEPRTPREMSAWLEKRKEIIEELREFRRAAGQVAEAEEEERLWCESLVSALGISAERLLADLVAKAERRVADADENRQKRNDVNVRSQQAQADLETEGQKQQQNESALDQWKGSWKAAIQVLPVSEAADPVAVKEVMRIVDAVWKNSDEIKDLQHRVESMQADEAGYADAVRALAVRAGRNELAEIDPLIAIGRIQTAARAAHESELAVERIEEDQSRRQRELSDALTNIERYAAALDDLRKEANVNDISLLPEAIEQSKRKAALSQQISGHAKALAISSAGIPLDAFIAEVQAADTDQLPARLEQLCENSKHLENARTEKTREHNDIDHEFQLREAASELSKSSCEKQLAAARIDFFASEYLERQIGAKLLARAMELYRDKHQDPLLKRAGEYFSDLTCGSFSGLAIAYENNVRVLKCVRRSGGATLGVEDMSDGARDQLFLALRLAYIENHCATNAPCPVILDDVLMAFDDNRAGAALKVLRDLSRKTQVLVFTHHAHHLQLAETVLGSDGFQSHELGTPITAAA